MDCRIGHNVTVLASSKALPCEDLPGAVLTNMQLSTLMEQIQTIYREDPEPRYIEISDESFPYDRIGILARRILDEYCTTRDLAMVAGKKCLTNRSDLDKIKAILVSTVTPDRAVPSIAVSLQDSLGLSHHVQGIDVHVGCSGATSTLELASRMLAGYPEGSRILVVGADAMSRVLDASDRSNCVIFGDGAGALLLGRMAEDDEIMASNPWCVRSAATYCDGSRGDLIEIRTDTMRMDPIYRFIAHEGQAMVKLDYHNHMAVHMDGRSVYKDMIKLVPAQIQEHLEGQGLGLDDIDGFVFHQANFRMIEMIAKRLGIPESKLRHNMDQIGNTTNGSVPILLHEEFTAHPQDEKRLLVVGFGTGYSLSIVLFERATV